MSKGEPKEKDIRQKMIEAKRNREKECLTEIDSVLKKHKCIIVPITNIAGGHITQSITVECR